MAVVEEMVTTVVWGLMVVAVAVVEATVGAVKRRTGRARAALQSVNTQAELSHTCVKAPL